MKLRSNELIVASVSLAVVIFALVVALNGAFPTDDSLAPKSENSVPEKIAPAQAMPAPAEKSPAPAQSVPARAVPVVNKNITTQPKLASAPAKAPRPAAKNFSCAGQICIDAETGEVLSSMNADVRYPPASVVKLMTIFVVLDAVSDGKISLNEFVVASRRAQEIGGTQVYLAEGEANSVEDLLYALMLQSANDAAVALAERVSGSEENFVAEMNRKARELGLSGTEFSTPHGLPLSKKERAAGMRPDMTTARDMANLARALVSAHPEVFRYTAARAKIFRENRAGTKPMPMGNHNKLLGLFPGCDGLKTGWTNAGASIVATASRGNRRVIAVVLGGVVPAAKGGPDSRASQRERNQRAAELMFNGFKKIDVLKFEPTPFVP